MCKWHPPPNNSWMAESDAAAAAAAALSRMLAIDDAAAAAAVAGDGKDAVGSVCPLHCTSPLPPFAHFSASADLFPTFSVQWQSESPSVCPQGKLFSIVLAKAVQEQARERERERGEWGKKDNAYFMKDCGESERLHKCAAEMQRCSLPCLSPFGRKSERERESE